MYRIQYTCYIRRVYLHLYYRASHPAEIQLGLSLRELYARTYVTHTHTVHGTHTHMSTYTIMPY